jgi:hypothetical protein
VGGSLGYFYISEGNSLQGPGLSVFLRLYSKTGNVALFLEPTVEYVHLGATGGSEDLVGPGADVGVEIFLADSWAVRLSPTFRYYKEWLSADNGPSADTNFTKFGLSWGISAYF